MLLRRFLPPLAVLGATFVPTAQFGWAQEALVSNCPTPALLRVFRHKVATGETLDQIAQRYNLIPSTLMGFNPAARNGKVTMGTELLIPPYNGIQVEVPSGKTWRDVAIAYKIKPDVLFEVNGCQKSPRRVFVPGVNWSPLGSARSQTALANSSGVSRGPVLTNTSILLKYGWYLNPQGQVVFHSGVDLAAAVGTPVSAAAAGTVAFAGTEGVSGKLVVINHQQGYQTRYAQLASIQVKVGQVVKQGQSIGTVGTTGQPSSQAPHLHFEVRSNSNLGWVAEDPTSFLSIQK
jgi:murein DD-endopeptidase MepM/ murein hydrolase activator NlpD